MHGTFSFQFYPKLITESLDLEITNKKASTVPMQKSYQKEFITLKSARQKNTLPSQSQANSFS